MQNRLDTIDLRLGTMLAKATPDQQHAAVAAAARLAVARVGLTGPDVEHAITVLQEQRSDRSLSDRIARLADRLDEKALHLREDANDGELPTASYMEAFTRARAAAALGYALADNSARTAAEGVYEAHAAIGGVDEIRRALTPILAAG